jgi:DNA-binding transcriptional regulator YdaS (Cro superfamily)
MASTASDYPPNDPVDQAARRAFRRACDRLGGRAAVSDVMSIGARNSERMYAGKRRIPPGVARQLAGNLRGIEPERLREQDIANADALEAWAHACEQEGTL